MDQSPHSAALGKGRGKGQRRPRKAKGAPGQVPVPPMNMGQNTMGPGQPGMPPMQGVQNNPQMSHMSSYAQGPTSMQQQTPPFGGNPNQQQWYNQQQPQQQGYYPQQMANGIFLLPVKARFLFKISYFIQLIDSSGHNKSINPSKRYQIC